MAPMAALTFSGLSGIIQAFANLVENAIRHAGPNATIIIEALRGPSVHGSVSDNGPGVPQADRQRILLCLSVLTRAGPHQARGLAYP
jgi:K+-sensing histidine kinase KdpD